VDHAHGASRTAPVEEVYHFVPESATAPLEFRRWPECERVGTRIDRREFRRCREHLQCVARVVRPVGCHVQQSVRCENARHFSDERRLHEPSFVVPILRPGIREEQVDCREAAARQQLRQNLGRVAPDYANVRGPGAFEQQQ